MLCSASKSKQNENHKTKTIKKIRETFFAFSSKLLWHLFGNLTKLARDYSFINKPKTIYTHIKVCVCDFKIRMKIFDVKLFLVMHAEKTIVKCTIINYVSVYKNFQIKFIYVIVKLKCVGNSQNENFILRDWYATTASQHHPIYLLYTNR